MSEQRRLKFAFVVQRYGEEINGGAEQHARVMAERLTAYADVSVLTTCAQKEDWANVYEPSQSNANGVTLHRFAVDQPRNYKTLERLYRIFLSEHSLADELAWIQAQGPISSTLLQHIERYKHDYDIFIFFTFEHATTYFGLPRVAEKSILLPLAHDHPFTRSAIFHHLFHLPAGIGYNTHETRRLVQSIAGNHQVPSEVLGVGLDPVESFDVAGFRERFELHDEFMLFVGRIDSNKNVPELLKFHLRYCETRPDAPMLAFIGRINNVTLPDHPKIRHLGFVSDEDVQNGFKAASIFIIPSLYESMSMVLREAWGVGTVTMAHSECTATREQTRRSNGGLFYSNYAEYAATVEFLMAYPEVREKLGAQGKAFVERECRWENIFQRLFNLVNIIYQRRRAALST